MTGHASVEQLSSYLDEELEARERRSVEDHLEGCERCRDRLGGLRRVVSELERLQEEAPPSHLGAVIRRRLGARPQPSPLLARFEERARRISANPPLLPLFGVLLALAVIFYLLSLFVARGDAGGSSEVIVPPSAQGAAAVAEPGWRRLAGRDLRQVDGVWLERGVDPTTAAAAVDPAELEPEVAAALAPLAELDAPVRLRLAGRVVELDPAALAAAP